MGENENKNTYNHILKYTSIFGGVQVLNVLIGIARNKILAVMLGTEGMGLMALLNSTVNFISQATNLGLPISAVRSLATYFNDGDEERIRRYIAVIRSWCFLAALLGMIICILAGPVLNAFSFSWGNHTLHFILLSPAVGMLAITGGETAIMKATRRLSQLAVIQLLSVFLIILITIPLVYFFGQSAIVPLIVSTALVSMCATIVFSYRTYPLRKTSHKGILKEGSGMVRLGLSFVVTAAFASGADMAIRAFLNVEASLDIVGLYNAGIMITLTYASLVFMAMETDYFPRLSAVSSDIEGLTDTVNKQAEVSILLLSPMLAALMLLLPVLIPLLFSSSFSPAVSMAQASMFAMYLRAVALPVAYIALAKGDSLPYLLIESFYSIMLFVCVSVGFLIGGLVGAGLGVSVSYLIEFIGNLIFTRLRYGFSLKNQAWKYIFLQYPLGLLAYVASLSPNPIINWTAGILIVVLSSVISISVFRKKTSLLDGLRRKYGNRGKQSAEE